MWFKHFIALENSKNQKVKNQNSRPIKYVACNKCHQLGKPLIKGKDSYYCVDCFNKLKNKEK